MIAIADRALGIGFDCVAFILGRVALPVFEFADHRIERMLHLRLRDRAWGEDLHRWLCQWSGHADVIWFNPCGFEPNMHCKRCGEDLG